MPADRPFEDTLDVVRFFVAEVERRDESDVVALVAIGKFLQDLELWARHFADRKGVAPGPDDLAEHVRSTPAHRYNELLAQARTLFARDAFDLLAPQIEEARQDADDERLARAARAGDTFMQYQQNDRFGRLFRDLEALADERRTALQPLHRLFDFGGHVLRGVLVTLVITLLLYVLLVILGADIGPRELIRRLGQPAG